MNGDEWWVYSWGFIPDIKIISEKIWDFFGILLEYDIRCFWAFNGDIYIYIYIYIYILYIYIYIYLPSIQLWVCLKWGFVMESNMAISSMRIQWAMVVRLLFFPRFSTDLICWKRISPPKNVWSTTCKVGYGCRPRWIIGLGFTVREKAYTWMLWRVVNPWHGLWPGRHGTMSIEEHFIG